MSATSWILAAGFVLLLWELYALTQVVKGFSIVATDRLSSLAQAAWRIRDELAEINKRNQSPSRDAD